MNKFNKRNKQFNILQLCHSYMIVNNFFKNNFHKQSQAEIAKKSSKF